MAHSNEIIAKVVSIQSSGNLGDIANVNESGRTEGSMLIYNLISQQYELTSDISGKLNHISGVATPQSAVILDSNLHVDVINVGAFTIDTSGGSAVPLTSISTTLSSGSLDNQLPTALAVENRIHEVDALNVVTTVDENSTDDGKPTALAVETRINEIHNQNTHTALANNSGAQRDLSTVISTLGNSKILILDDIASGDSLNLDSTDEGLEYVLINTSTNTLTITAPGVLTLVDGSGATSTGDRSLAVSGICTVIRDNSPSVSNWVIFGNGGLS